MQPGVVILVIYGPGGVLILRVDIISDDHIQYSNVANSNTNGMGRELQVDCHIHIA